MTDLTYRSFKTEVRISPIHGKGLFAKAPIERGEIVAVKGDYIINQQQWAEIEPALGSAEIQITEDLQDKYKGWFCWFLQRKIDALSSNQRGEADRKRIF